MKNKKIKTPALINAKQMAQDHPETFSVPEDTELRLLKVGSLVKVSTDGERFWVQITSATYPLFIGRVDNDLLFVKGLSYNDLIQFHAANIYQIYKDL